MTQIDNLKAVIHGRPVAVLLPGISIKELEERITELKDIDICYASVNDFWIMEQNILNKIGKRLEIVMCSAKECNVPTRRHRSYLKRGNNMFLTEEVSFQKELERYKQEFGNQLFFFTTDHLYTSLDCPTPANPFHFFAQASLAILMSICLMGGADTIILFGADGGNRNDDKLYYRGWRSLDRASYRLGYDTGVLNMTWFNLLKNVALTTGLRKLRIINASPKTYYAPFPIATYDAAIEFLKAEYGIAQNGAII